MVLLSVGRKTKRERVVDCLEQITTVQGEALQSSETMNMTYVVPAHAGHFLGNLYSSHFFKSYILYPQY